jgi:hypothetical protein
MVKSLIETYKTIKEATNVFRAQAAGLGAAPAAPKPVDAKAQGFPARPAASPSTSGTSTAFGGRPAPSNAINNLGRVSQQSGPRPLPMGGSVPGRQVNSTMMAARSSNMQGRPAGSPTQAVNVNRQVTSTGNPNVAGGTAPVRTAAPAPVRSTGAPQNRMDVVRQSQDKAKRDARIQAVSRPAAPAPRPGDKVPGEKVATNSELTGQAMARKGFGNDTGGGNYPAARQKPPTQYSSTNGERGQARLDFMKQQQDKAKQNARVQAIRRPGGTTPSKPETDTGIGNPMGDYNPGQDNSTPTTTKSQSQLNTEPDVNTTDKPTAGIPPKPTTKPARTAPQTQTQKPGVVKKPNVPVKPIRKPQAAGTQNNMTAAQRAQQNRRVERGNARPGEKTIGLGIKTGKVTGKTARSNRPIGSSPLKEGMLNNKQLSEMIKTLRNKSLKEQNPKAEASSYRERQQFKPVHVSDPYNKKDQSPNDYMHRMAEGMQQSTLGPHRDRKMNPNSTTLGNLVSRNRGGNQSMNNRYESAETDLGSTDTGKKGREAETVSVNPKDTTASATGSMNKNTKTTIKELKEK